MACGGRHGASDFVDGRSSRGQRVAAGLLHTIAERCVVFPRLTFGCLDCKAGRCEVPGGCLFVCCLCPGVGLGVHDVVQGHGACRFQCPCQRELRAAQQVGVQRVVRSQFRSRQGGAVQQADRVPDAGQGCLGDRGGDGLVGGVGVRAKFCACVFGLGTDFIA